MGIEIAKSSHHKTANAQNFVVLAGAGISHDFPSCFPLTHQITEQLCQWLGAEDERLAQRAREALDQRGINPFKFVRFEQVWQTLETLMPDISQTLEVLQYDVEPNTNHFNLARLIVDGGSVITTNFDTFIEQACKDLDYTKPPFVFGRDTQFPEKCRFFKMHGSFDTEAPLLSTLFHIGSAGFSFSKHEDIIEKLKIMVQGKTLIVTGYSASDHFDIVPMIENHWQPAHIVWMDYDERPKQPVWTRHTEKTDNLDIIPETDDFVNILLSRLANNKNTLTVHRVHCFALWQLFKFFGLLHLKEIDPASHLPVIEGNNMAFFAKELTETKWDKQKKLLAVQMLEKRDGFGFHISLDTHVDNEDMDWATLEDLDEETKKWAVLGGIIEEEAKSPNEDIFEIVKVLVQTKKFKEAEQEIQKARDKIKEPYHLDIGVAEIYLLREQHRLEEAYDLQKQLIKKNYDAKIDSLDPEDAEMFVALAEDYFFTGTISNQLNISKKALADINHIFETTGVIWAGISALSAEAELDRIAFMASKEQDFSKLETALEKARLAAYYWIRSGRWDKIIQSVMELSWYLAITQQVDRTLDFLDKAKKYCPPEDRFAWLNLSVQRCMNAALYGFPDVAEEEADKIEGFVKREDENEAIFLLISLAAKCFGLEKKQIGIDYLSKAKKKITHLEEDGWNHSFVIEMLESRFLND